MLGVVSCPNVAGANLHITSIMSALGCIIRRGEMTYGAARLLADERVQYWNASGGWGWRKHGAVRQTGWYLRVRVRGVVRDQNRSPCMPKGRKTYRIGRIPVAKPRHALRHDENILFGTDSNQRSATLPLQKWSSCSR